MGAAQRVAQRVLVLEELIAVRCVALYAAVGDEVPLDAVAHDLARRGACLVYPRVSVGGGELGLFEVAGPGALVAGYRNTPEPPRGAPAVDLDVPDVWLVPGRAYDRAGRRLGRGGGHYDLALAAARRDARAVGICYANRIVSEVPAAAWDVPVSVVVTEAEVIRPERAAAAPESGSER